jgi:hypothetical protein
MGVAWFYCVVMLVGADTVTHQCWFVASRPPLTAQAHCRDIMRRWVTRIPIRPMAPHLNMLSACLSPDQATAQDRGRVASGDAWYE